MKNNHLALIRDLLRQANQRSFSLAFLECQISPQDGGMMPVPTVVSGENTNMLYPKHKPEVPLYSAVPVGHLPTNIYMFSELKKDWMVTRVANTKEVVLAALPPINCPILVNYENRTEPLEGFVAIHQIDDLHTELVFMELDRTGLFEVSAIVPTRLGHNAEVTNGVHVPQILDGMIGWSYLNSRGASLIEGSDEKVLELFMDVKHEGKNLLSAGLVTREGVCHYALNEKRMAEATSPWNVGYVEPVAAKAPPGAHTSLLTADEGGFEWFSSVINNLLLYRSVDKVLIRVDYTTDVEHIAAFMHRINGSGVIERFDKHVPRVEFIVDYVDTYPCSIADAIQHNAAWDAVALWCKLGYDRYYTDRSRIALAVMKNDL